MKLIVFSCKYPDLLPHFAVQLKKYYADSIEVIVLSNKDLPSLPDNFSHYRLPSYTESWVDDIYPFFEQFDKHLFLSCMEDHFLYDYVDMSVIGDALALFDWEHIDKFGFQIGPRGGSKRYNVDPVYHEMHIGCNLASSLQPAIWKTDYFKKILDASRGLNAWDFETQNKNPELVVDHTVLYKESPEPWPVADVVRNSRSNREFWDKRLKCRDDREIFETATAEIFG